MRTDQTHRFPPAIATLVLLTFVPVVVQAHCDGMDGPVVRAATQALDRGDLNMVLIWIQAGDEPGLRKASTRAMAVRNLNPQAKELADLYFFETVVRLHRAGEGAPYTGLKPAGRDLGPAIPAADKAVEEGSGAALVKMLTEASVGGVRERFAKVLATKNFKGDNVQAGREYVKAYIEFVHYIERLYSATRASGHDPSQSGKTVGHEHQ